MAQTEKNADLRFWRAAEYDPLAGYVEPAELALVNFLEWLRGTYRDIEIDTGEFPGWMPQSYQLSAFHTSGERALCLYDLAYVWLAETDAVRYCPTFESWTLFLVAFADAVHFLREEGMYDHGSAIFAIATAVRTDAEAVGMHEIAYVRQLDLLYRESTQRPCHDDREEERRFNRDLPRFAGSYAHPALRRDVYEQAAARARYEIQRETLSK